MTTQLPGSQQEWGYDPNDEIDQRIDDRLSQSSQLQKTLVQVLSDTLSLTVLGTQTLPYDDVVSVAHNLGYVPVFIAYLKVGSQYFQMPAPDISGNYNIQASADENNLYVNLRQTGRQTPGDFTYNIKYYLFREPAQ